MPASRALFGEALSKGHATPFAPPLLVAIRSRVVAHGVCAALPAIICALAYSRTMAPGLTWANHASDSGDLITAAVTGGVAHPTSYPTYLLLAWLVQQLPIGDPAFCTTVLSALAAVLTLLVVYVLVLELLGDRTWRATSAAGIASLGLGLSAVFWSQAAVAEVYSLNGLFAAVILLFMAYAAHAKGLAFGWSERLHGAVVGLALGNHITIVPLAIAWLMVVPATTPAGRIVRVARRLIWIGAGLLIYLTLPLRAATGAPPSWGGAATWDGFWWTVTGRAYAHLPFSLPGELVGQRLSAWAGLLAGQFGVVGLGLGFFGLLYAGAHARRVVWPMAGAAGALSLFAAGYNTADSYLYLIPAYVTFAVWIGLGLCTLIKMAEQRERRLVPLVVGVPLVLLLMRLPETARQVDASHDYRAIDYARDTLANAPAGALIMTATDQATFPLWYYHYARGMRPDIAVVAGRLLDFSWYRANLQLRYPGLHMPTEPTATWNAAFVAANRARGPICWTTDSETPQLICEPSVRTLER